MRVIFLDVDGVLNSYARGKAGNLSKSMLRRLRDLVELTDSKIVVSSAWRKEPYMMRKLLRYLGYKKLKILGCTPVIPNAVRGEEIKYWINHNCDVEHFVILDDMAASEFPGLEKYLVETDPTEGLTADKMMEAVYVLEDQE